MRVVVQRVSEASLWIDSHLKAEIGLGLVVLAGFGATDQSTDVQWMAEKVAGLRVFADEEGKMNLSVAEVGGEVLAVPNFTLHGDCRKGRRPGFSAAAPPEAAAGLFESFVEELGKFVPVKSGVFGAHMHVRLTNDGPVTLLIDSEKTF